MSNSIGSLRFLSAMDWKEFVESMSVVDQTLRHDPGGVYDKMDFLPVIITAMSWKRSRNTAGFPRARWRTKQSGWPRRVRTGTAVMIARNMSAST